MAAATADTQTVHTASLLAHARAPAGAARHVECSMKAWRDPRPCLEAETEITPSASAPSGVRALLSSFASKRVAMSVGPAGPQPTAPGAPAHVMAERALISIYPSPPEQGARTPYMSLSVRKAKLINVPQPPHERYGEAGRLQGGDQRRRRLTLHVAHGMLFLCSSAREGTAQPLFRSHLGTVYCLRSPWGLTEGTGLRCLILSPRSLGEGR